MFSWRSSPKFNLVAGTFGELGLQIMQAASRGQTLAVCSGCGNPYMRQGRKPQSGRRNYCPRCGVKASRRDAQRQRRTRLNRGESSVS
jgi:hypothetical protein